MTQKNLDPKERIDVEIGVNFEFDRDAARLHTIGASTNADRTKFFDDDNDSNCVYWDVTNGDNGNAGTQAAPVADIVQASQVAELAGKTRAVQLDNAKNVLKSRDYDISNGVFCQSESGDVAIGFANSGALAKWGEDTWFLFDAQASTDTTDSSKHLDGRVMTDGGCHYNVDSYSFTVGGSYRTWRYFFNQANADVTPDEVGAGAANYDTPYGPYFRAGDGVVIHGHVNSLGKTGSLIATNKFSIIHHDLTNSPTSTVSIESGNKYCYGFGYFGRSFVWQATALGGAETSTDLYSTNGNVFRIVEGVDFSGDDATTLIQSKNEFIDALDFSELKLEPLGHACLEQRIFAYWANRTGTGTQFWVCYSDDFGETWFWKRLSITGEPTGTRAVLWSNEGTARGVSTGIAAINPNRECFKSNTRDTVLAILPFMSDNNDSYTGLSWLKSSDGLNFEYKTDSTNVTDSDVFATWGLWLGTNFYIGTTADADPADNNKMYRLSSDFETVAEEITQYKVELDTAPSLAGTYRVLGAYKSSGGLAVIAVDTDDNNFVHVLNTAWAITVTRKSDPGDTDEWGLAGFRFDDDFEVGDNANGKFLSCTFEGWAASIHKNEKCIFKKDAAIGRMVNNDINSGGFGDGSLGPYFVSENVDCEFRGRLMFGLAPIFDNCSVLNGISAERVKQTGFRIRDSIIEGNIITASEVNFQSGNLRGYYPVNVTIGSDVSFVDPLFLDAANEDYRLATKADDGFDFNSLLIAQSVYSTYEYLTVTYQRDFGPHNYNINLLETKYNTLWPLLKPDNIRKIFSPTAFLNVARSGKVYARNRASQLSRSYLVRWTEVDEDVITLLELILADTELQVRLNLWPELGETSTFNTNATASVGDFYIQAADSVTINQGDNITFGGNEYIVLRVFETGGNKQILLSRNVLTAVSNPEQITRKQINGAQEYKVRLTGEIEQVLQVSQNPKAFSNGVELEFVLAE